MNTGVLWQCDTKKPVRERVEEADAAKGIERKSIELLEEAMS